MSQAGQIDGLQFARERERCSGVLELDALSRLAELGCRSVRVDYVIEGAKSATDQLCLRVEIAGRLELECQRCLEPLEYAVKVRGELELAVDPGFIETADDDVDRVLATHSMDVAGLIEDELILELPMIPMHVQCETAVDVKAEKPSPFAALASLKKKAGNPEN